jgi:hypothetical protein
MALTPFSYSRLTSYESCPRKYYGISVSKKVKDAGNEHTEYGEEVHKAFAEYFKKNKSLPMHLTQYQKFLSPIKAAPGAKIVEQKVAINAKYEGTGWFDADVYCRVISDLTIINDERAVMWDWKTGKPSDDFTQLKLAAAVTFLLAPDVQHITMAYLWLKTKRATFDKIARDEAPLVWAELNPRLPRYQAAHVAGDFPARPSRLCCYCPDKSCPYWEAKK